MRIGLRWFFRIHLTLGGFVPVACSIEFFIVTNNNNKIKGEKLQPVKELTGFVREVTNVLSITFGLSLIFAQ